MASKEHEQSIAEQKYVQVKQELAALREVIKKQEAAVAAPQEQPAATLNAHEITELFIEKKDDSSQKAIAFEKGKSTATQPHPTLDVSPGSHTVVEL